MDGVQAFLNKIALVPCQPPLPDFLLKVASTSMRTSKALVKKLLLDFLVDLQWALAGISQTHLGSH